MSEGEKTQIVKEIEAGAGSEGYVDLYVVPGGKRFTLSKVRVHFSADCNYNLSLAIYFGNVKILPTDGYFIGSDEDIDVETSFTYESNEAVKLYYKNVGTTVAHATVTLEGEMS